MFVKKRVPSYELQVLQSLKPRMYFSETLQKRYNLLVKGFEGEILLDRWLHTLALESLVLPDLIFEVNKSCIQIDTLFITPASTYLFEVKNYEGEFKIEGDKWRTRAGNDIQNPLFQLHRSETIFRQVLQNLNLPPVNLKPLVVFPNPEFTLFNASPDLPVILPTQLPRFFKNIEATPGHLSKNILNISNQLLSQSLTKSPYLTLPEYTYSQLSKGILCPKCYSRLNKITQRELRCGKCHYSETVREGVFRSVKDFQLLFPEKELTTAGIYEWCGGTAAKKVIQNTLFLHFTQKGKHKKVCYI
ncbi:nuclease-related domain-containing protein [Salipaludibacillus aurantiacus]|uniref:Nuclease-related domain-containing protein n=1 Tax=Salipaludibacillus aurantiacus TaxID=1601833 RepID=A0A1H9SEF9_9BACI|nr:nuclease-related domain-containing protein [Salipaludibacillus aurantiacus]SER83374.1 Nuclease-related domain-containing protein [Salipaludibacillus aurantiacus]